MEKNLIVRSRRVAFVRADTVQRQTKSIPGKLDGSKYWRLDRNSNTNWQRVAGLKLQA